MTIFFDSRKEYCKSPFGAVESGTRILFRAGVERRAVLKEMILAIYPDNGAECHVRGSWTDLRDGSDFYSFEWETNKEGLFFYYFIADYYDGRRERSKSSQLTVYLRDYRVPEWLRNGVMYQIFPDRFARSAQYVIPALDREYRIHENWNDLPDYKPDAAGVIRNNDFFGGNLKGMVEMLPYLKDLGVTVLYLNPIVEAYSNHRYDTADFKNVDPILGSVDDFRTLCQESGKLGIRILLDGVFNHTGSDSIYFNKYGRYAAIGAYQSKDSIYYPWYQFTHYPDKYHAWWGIETLPHVNETEGTYLDHIIRGDDSVIKFWMSCGASGFRIDVADELPSAFLEELRSTLKGIDRNAAIIGEVWEDASNKISYGERRRYLLGKELDSVMNYPLKDALIRFVAYERDAAAFSSVVCSLWENYPPAAFSSLMNILGTHDTARILTILGIKDELYRLTKDEKARLLLTEDQRGAAVARLFLALMIWAFMPGIPCIYYGDEIGMQGAEDPFNRKCFDFKNADLDMHGFYKKLLALRNGIPDIGNYDFRPVMAERSIFIFSRCSGGRAVFVAVNTGKEREEFSLQTDCGANFESRLSVGEFQTVETGGYLLGSCSGVIIFTGE